jgi:fatty-acid desaturase
MVSFYDTDLKYATNRILQDDLYKFQLKWYPLIAIIYYVVWSAIFDPTSWLIINGFAYIGQVTINYIAHAKLKPVNRPAFALLLSAETYHANHHKYPTEARFGKYDLPYLMFIESVDPQTFSRIPQWTKKDD